MRLYHFTAMHHLTGGVGRHAGPGIENVGLHPHPHPLISLPGMVWLTADPTWAQEWSPRPVPGVDCDRTEVRLTVAVPKSAHGHLLGMREIRPFIDADWQEDFDAHGEIDVSGWRAFVGQIPRGWIRAWDPRP